MLDKRFEQIVVEIFENYGFSKPTQFGLTSELCNIHPVRIMVRNDVVFSLLIRESRNLMYSSKDIVPEVQELVRISKERNWIPVTVIGGVLKSSVIAEILGASIRSTIVDIEHLMYMAKSDSTLYDQLMAQLLYSVRSLMPREPIFPTSSQQVIGDENKCKPASVEAGCENLENKQEKLITHCAIQFTGPRGGGKSSWLYSIMYENQLRNADLPNEIEQWVCGNSKYNSRRYEKLCTRTLMRLFAEDLTLWREQARTDEGLSRFDLVCKIKRDNRKDFWEMAERYFHSKYIIFEFKNYSGKVTQNEIHSTLRYLYPKALRAIAIIISPNGTNSNADKVIRSALREEGKLIISLTNDELLQMLRMKEDGEDPADYLSDRLDDMLVSLEK